MTKWLRKTMSSKSAAISLQGDSPVIRIERSKFALLIFAVVALSILIEPACIMRISGVLHQAVRFGKYFVSALTVNLFILSHTKLKFPLIGIIAFEFILLMSSFISSGTITEQIREIMYTVILISIPPPFSWRHK